MSELQNRKHRQALADVSFLENKVVALERLLEQKAKHLEQVKKLIRDWLRTNGDYYPAAEGIHVLEYPHPAADLYVALAQSGLGKPRYVGWFTVRRQKLGSFALYDFCCEQNGLWLYRAIHDRLSGEEVEKILVEEGNRVAEETLKRDHFVDLPQWLMDDPPSPHSTDGQSND